MLRLLLFLAAAGVSIAAPSQIPLSLEQGSIIASLKWPQNAEYRQQLAEHIKSFPEQRLVRYELDGRLQEAAISEGEKALLVYSGIKFDDVTNDGASIESWSAADALPKTLKYGKKDLAKVFKEISTKRMRGFLSEFSSFRTRYYRSSSGKESQQFLLKHIKEAVSQSKTPITVEEFEHNWGQNSIIVKFATNSTNLKDKKSNIVIIGAHQDSTNLLPFLGAPGADDDGSGTTTILETLTNLVATGFAPSNSSLEFHFYSAEEGGLLGSNAVAQAYKSAGKSVKSMLQLDMTAYVKPGTEERIGVIQDFVDSDLTAFLEKIAKEYADIPVVKTQCGYACSDHASWSKIGARSAFAIESSFEDSDKNIHSGRDTIDVAGFSFDHMAQFVKLATAFAVELTA